MVSEREKALTQELNRALTGILLEVFAGTMKDADAIELLLEMRKKIEPAINAIDETIEKIKQERQKYGLNG